ncbi:MAG: glycosyltransferase [Candidatus Pacearchaeota archaeon]|jgi:lipopolysaccharide biosynthesis glycosyltransferase
MKKNVLITLADKNYIEQAKTLFSSAYFNGGWDEDFLLLSFEIPEKKLNWFKNKGIKIIRCKKIDSTDNIFNKEHSLICINKFYMFTDYFKKWDKVIYLDSDIIVKSSLLELKKYKGFYATIDPTLRLKNQIISGYKYNFLRYLFKKSFNAGVLVFNTEIIKENSFNELKNLFNKYKNKIKYSDQTILNLYFSNKIKELPLVYNVYNKIMDEKIKPINLHIIINSQDKKPWEIESRYYNEWSYFNKIANKIYIKPIKKTHILSEKEIIRYSNILKSRLKKLHYKELFYKTKELIKKPFRQLSYFKGKIGLIIKKKNKKLYYFLRGKN